MECLSVALACTIYLESRALYAPATLKGDLANLWVGGWRTEQDIGSDRIYRIDRLTGDLVLGLARDDAHVNDPSLVRPPSDAQDRSPWVFMYYTGLYNEHAASEAFDRHWIGLASSIDQGMTWTDHGPILAGWAPSALVVGSEIWIYYHDNLARAWRVRVHGNGWRPLGPPERLGVDKPMTNLDISGSGPFALAANKPDLTEMILGMSLDGLNFFTAQAMGATWHQDTKHFITPHIDEQGSLYFAISPNYLTGPFLMVKGERR